MSLTETLRSVNPMRIKTFLLTLWVLIATPLFTGTVQGQAPDSLLTAYVRESLQNHPDLTGMQAMATAESSRTVMSRAWMNPELSVGLMNSPDNFDLHMDPATMWQIGIMQRVPFPGKLKAAGEAGRARTLAAETGTEAARFDMASMTAMAYYDLAAALSVRRSLEKGKDLLQQMMDAARVMTASGMGSQADLLRARLELEQWNVRLISNQADIDRKRAALAYALGRRDETTLGNPVLPDSLPPTLDLDSALQPSSIDSTPSIRRAHRELEAAAADTRRARLEYWPDVDVMASYGFRGYLRTAMADDATGETGLRRMKQDGMVSIELSAPLPLFYHGNQRARIGEMTAMQSGKEADLAKERLDKERQLRELYARWKETADCCRIAQGKVLPQAEAAWQATLIEYRAGRTSFMALSEARMSVVMAEMELLMHRADAWASYRQWLSALGEPWFETRSDNR
jgi:outer membrane protein TolC